MGLFKVPMQKQVKMEKVEIICKKCKKKLGDVCEDYQYFEVENVKLFFPTKIFCKCGKFFDFSPKPTPEVLSDEQIAVSKMYRFGLGRPQK